MKKAAKPIAATLLFFCLISAFFLFLTYKGEKSARVSTLNELESVDLGKTAVLLHSGLFEWYPNQLLTSQDFDGKSPTEGEGSAMFGTYRAVISLPVGKTYGITGHACSYGQRVFINGQMLSEIGNVSDNAQDFVPRTDYYTVFFTPQTGETEIIIQMAHFNNKNGYYNAIYLGEQELIVRGNRLTFLSDGLTVGTLFAFAVFYLGMFLFYPEKKHMLWFALACFCSGLYFFIFQSKDLNAFVPSLSWAVSHKLEYLSEMGSYVFFVAYVFSLLKIKARRWQIAAFWVPISAVVLYYIIAPSTVYSYYQHPIFVYCLVVIVGTVYILQKSIANKLFKPIENTLVLLSLVAYIALYMTDLITSRNNNLSPFATILVVFFNAVSITMYFSRTEKELNLAQLREREVSETNEMLSRMGELKNEFFHNIAHEMRTPLTVMGGYAQLTAMQIEKDKVTPETIDNLKTVSTEAMRLADMVSRLMKLTFDKELSPTCTKLDPMALLEDVADICRPIVQKNSNDLILLCETSMPILGNAEAFLQVFINLAVNANRHTQKGEIRFRASLTGDKVTFYVENNGEGIQPELVPYIFEKGVSGDGSSGLGLAICRDIIRQCEGEIWLEETGENGTAFAFTAPIYEEEKHE